MGAADDDAAAERFRSWYLSREEIERGSPSRRDGIDAAKEAKLRATYSSFIRDVCIRLKLPQITIATAVLLCHRFYLRQSLAKNEWQTVATVCVFLASKIEDTPCGLRRVVIVAYEMMYNKNPDAAKSIHQNVVLEKQKALILVGETLLLSTIGFDFNIQHPYDPLKLALKNLGITQKEVRQTAVNFINDTLPTTLALQFKPHYIAAGSLFLAAKFHNLRLSETGKIWWQEFEVAPKLLQVVLQQMTELFKKRDPCSMGPAIKPTPIPTPVDKKQMISAPSSSIKRPPPALMDRQQITSTQGLAGKHAQSSSRRTGKSDTVASRCPNVDSSSRNKSICSSARHEQNQSLRLHINNTLDIVAVGQRSEKQSSWGALKSDHVYHVSTGAKETSKTSIRDLTRHKRRIQEIGGYPAAENIPDQGAWIGKQLTSVIVIETNSSWKRQKVESNEDDFSWTLRH